MQGRRLSAALSAPFVLVVEITWTIAVRTAEENWSSVRAALQFESARSASGFVSDLKHVEIIQVKTMI